MRSERRPDPAIPDHEVLRRIGGGAYGEVWLARAVTGALRAVKVVWREDFEDDRGFEREFEGILKFEPVSRDHPGLMNILHVGRSTGAAPFYYCVMELGDDVRRGHEVNPIDYEPRTLRSDIRTAAGKPLPTGLCIDVGLRLAEALEHLHARGLAHRDIKPSNVIFVSGKPKLADIGLVAARGQRTFVGTEGFVPPEGPGSARADVYSLGKVLYECATGKDRLEFPELPDELPQGAELRQWQALNAVICDVCEPHVSRRRVQTAADLATTLRALQRGRRPRRRTRLGAWLTVAVLAALALAAGWQALQMSPWAAWLDPARLLPQPGGSDPQIGMVRIQSYPEGADVFDENGHKVGTTPTATLKFEVGQRVRMTLRKEGFRTFVIDDVVGPDAVTAVKVFDHQMEKYVPPEPERPWVDQLGMRYQPVNGSHLSTGFVPASLWRTFAKEAGWQGPAATLRHTESGEQVEIALTNREGALAYCAWLADHGVSEGYLTDEFQVAPRLDQGFDISRAEPRARAAKLQPFRVVVDPVRFATLEIATEPAGAEVFIDDEPAGAADAPLRVERLRPGQLAVKVVLDGFRTRLFKLTLAPGEEKEFTARLERNQSVVFGQPWENHLGMTFAPVGRNLMVSVWETRVRDYAAFVRDSDYVAPLKPSFQQDPDHPVVYVSRADAEAFCAWLTERERASEWIAAGHAYRLPTDLEWSRLVDLAEDPAATPAERSARVAEVYPWGWVWLGPRAPLVGNLADESALRLPGVSPDRMIPGYDDGFETTAPVGSFPPNRFGIHDLCGNVHEWVADNYGHRSTQGVLRGGGWNTYQRENLYSGARNTAPPDFVDNIYGFRVVLARVPRPEPAPEPAEPATPEPQPPPAPAPTPAPTPSLTPAPSPPLTPAPTPADG